MNWKKCWLLPFVYLLLVNDLTTQDFTFQEAERGVEPFEFQPFSAQQKEVAKDPNLEGLKEFFAFKSGADAIELYDLNY
ncbi:hypothetical protein [uncultured Cyclobacterium sp.]|uniref:hypothetical protein n=1 Tax=uncultured Cyclobacterium sp. TaxID=453820 RepID=UPI0030EEBB8E|tara:strand:+ start:41010 stop:41246 length:237 start_codon:yes stop_codon:yes gene_type:complete